MESDQGVANERTALAWQRTALSVAAGAVIVARLSLDRIGAVALVPIVVGVPLAAWAFWESRARYLHDAHIRRRFRPRGGRAPLALCLVTLAIGSTELVALLLT